MVGRREPDVCTLLNLTGLCASWPTAVVIVSDIQEPPLHFDRIAFGRIDAAKTAVNLRGLRACFSATAKT